MKNGNKYFRGDGCCICGTKNSTSSFRPWYEHYTEETYCRVFQLQSLEGRRGHICNPCVLFIKRTLISINNNCLNADTKQRLDMKLKRRRHSGIKQVLPPTTRRRKVIIVKKKKKKKLGYVVRNMRVYPKYVMIGQKYLKLKSKYQLIPAGAWQDPREFLEDESDAEVDLPKYRRVTLKKRRKTIEQKVQKKIEAEAEENRRLFGELDDGELNEKKEANGEQIAEDMPLGQKHITSTPPRKRRAKARCASARNKRAGQTASMHNGVDAVKSYGTRSKGKKATSEKSLDEGHNEETLYEDTDEETDTGDEMIDKEDFPEDQRDKRSLCPEVAPRKKRKREIEEDVPEVAPRKKSIHEIKKNVPEVEKDYAVASTSSMAHNVYSPGSSTSAASSTAGKIRNRRVLRAPVKNFKRPKVSFMDCTYWQKFMLCCFTIYVGEGGMCVIRPHGLKECPREKKKKLQCLQLSMTNSRTRVLKPTEGDESVQSSLQGLLSSAGASTSRAADEEWEVESALSSELQHSQGTGAPNTSSQDELLDLDSDASIALKETGADRYSETGSFMSSGEDELTDSRMGATTSPMIEEKPCRKFFP